MTVFLYNAAIHAYGTLNDWRSALDLYCQMKNNGVKPNERTLVSLITILGKFGQPDEALAVFQDCELPNARYYDAFICTLGCCGKWELCCQVFDEMLANKLFPSEKAYYAVIDVLETWKQPRLADERYSRECRAALEEIQRSKGMQNAFLQFHPGSYDPTLMIDLRGLSGAAARVVLRYECVAIKAMNVCPSSCKEVKIVTGIETSESTLRWELSALIRQQGIGEVTQVRDGDIIVKLF
jgi:pentatricopeptide repeat protein